LSYIDIINDVALNQNGKTIIDIYTRKDEKKEKSIN